MFIFYYINNNNIINKMSETVEKEKFLKSMIKVKISINATMLKKYI